MQRTWRMWGPSRMRVVLFMMCIIVTLIILSWSRCAYFTSLTSYGRKGLLQKSGKLFEDIKCNINGEYTIDCWRDSSDVFVPFTFLHKYFEVYGKVATATDSDDSFEWSHSYGKVFRPKRPYDPRGVFMTFENYNVEVRERVKCISGIAGVPLSTQWEPNGYFYPTQIAQFGLAHYSKNLTEPAPRRWRIEDADKVRGNWRVSIGATLHVERDQAMDTNVVKFKTSASPPGGQIWLHLNWTQDFVLDLDIMLLQENSSLVVALQDNSKNTFYLHYVSSNELIKVQDNKAFYGIGSHPKWKHITRDLIVDMQKAWALIDRTKQKAVRNKYKISSIILSGLGQIDNLTLSSAEHGRLVLAAADWLVENQDAKGGWPIPVARRIASGFLRLKPGWYSAMSQGHAMSLLCRAWHVTRNSKYLNAARDAMRLFHVTSENGGVKTHFFNKYLWFEEYPTIPSSFVLNGFMYALFGLYDLYVTDGNNSTARKLFESGIESLKAMLPFYDTGSGSVYDLRHVALGIAPNVARWDYHATHITQLYALATVRPDISLLTATARRWENYMKGHRASHN